MIIKFLGINRVDFTPKDGGSPIIGYKIHMAIPADHGVGLVSQTFFMDDNRFYELFGGDLNAYKDKALSDVDVQCFGRRLMSVSFKK